MVFERAFHMKSATLVKIQRSVIDRRAVDAGRLTIFATEKPGKIKRITKSATVRHVLNGKIQIRQIIKAVPQADLLQAGYRRNAEALLEFHRQ